MEIRVESVTKNYHSKDRLVHALGPVSLTIGEGEFVSLIGPSGCGKSTTLLLVAGLEKTSSGKVFLEEKELVEPITDVGIVFQDHLLLDFRTALGNVMLQQKIRKLNETALLERAHQLFSQLRIEGTETRYPKELSGGQRQRVSIARALVHDPSLLLMDEPFGALDAITRTQIRHDLELLWLNSKKSVLFITHSIEEAIGLSDKIIVMSDGPGKIIEEINITIPRPRPAHLGDYPEFAEFSRRIYSIFEEMGIYKFKDQIKPAKPISTNDR